MSASSQHSKVIKTRIERDANGVYSVSCDELPGLVVVSKDIGALQAHLIPRAIEDLYRACGVAMIVDRIETDAPADIVPWVAMRASIARERLEQVS